MGRRAFALGVGGLVVAGARRVRARSTERILIVGDSMIAGALGLFLERTLREDGHVVRRRGRSSTGLARPDFYDWPKGVLPEVEDFAPTTSLVMFGGNDVQGLYMGKVGGVIQWIRWQEPGWVPEYTRRAEAMCQALSPAGQRIAWIGMPVMRPPKHHARVQRINEIARDVMRRRPASVFVDTWHKLAGPTGEYADDLPIEEGNRAKKVRVRAGDGIHLTTRGARFLADHVREVLRASLLAT